MLENFFMKLDFCRVIFLIFNIIFSTTLALDPYSDNWGVTQINAKKISYSWTISNYSLNNKEFGQCLRSPVFSNDNSENYKWQLELCPKGFSESYKNYVAIFLYLVSGPQLKAYYEFNIVNGYEKKVIFRSDRTEFAPNNKRHGYYEVIPLDDLKNESKNLLPDDRLTVLVDVIINNGTTDISGERCSALNADSNAEQMLTLFEDGLFSDVELHTDGRVFKAHRGILAAHSSWFSKQFNAHPNITSFDIEKISSKALKEVLRYIYLGKIENLNRIAKELLDASNWLGISQLKVACERALCKTINPKNAIEVLTLAELYDAEVLKRQASKYIAAHATDVIDSPDYKNLQASNPHPLFEIFRALINRNRTYTLSDMHSEFMLNAS